MRRVFADSGYWIALINPRDSLHQKAKSISSNLGLVRIITSEMVLAEVLNSLAGKGADIRRVASVLIEQLENNPNTDVVPLTSIQFKEALNLYKSRPDKDWSLTDCASIQILQEKGVVDTLSYDKHFIQAGFTSMLREED